MRKFGAVVLASVLFAGAAFGAEAGGLPAGNPAGIAAAQRRGNETLYVITLGVIVVAGAAYLVSTKQTHSVITTFPGGPNTIVPVNTSVSTTTTTTQ